MRLLFAGASDIAVPSLQLLNASYGICAVLTAADRRQGRGLTLQRSPVKIAAERLDIPILSPERLDAAAREQVSSYSPDLLVCFAYGRFFGPRFVALFPRGAINLHPSLLPHHRGPSPIPSAILAGDSVTGVTVQYVSQDLDAGDVLLQEQFALRGDETTTDLSRDCADRGARLLCRAVEAIEIGADSPIPQDHAAATYTKMIRTTDGAIDWSRSASHVERMARAYTPWPGIYTFFQKRRLSLLAVAPAPDPTDASPLMYQPGAVFGTNESIGILIQTGDGVLAVRRLKIETRQAHDWRDFLNGNRQIIGSILQ